MGTRRVWALAVGGMVGGGIFSVLGVVVSVAGSWAWLSFVLAGLVVGLSVPSYTNLAARFHEGGGAFAFLRETDHDELAGTISWLLTGGYVLTIAVYAATFGNYVSAVLDLPGTAVPVLAVGLVGLLVVLNLRGAGDVSAVELVTVGIELLLLGVVAAVGLSAWAPAQLGAGVPQQGPLAAVTGAAAILMAFEGWQLLTYDYEDVEQPDRTLPRALASAVAVVMLVYLAVAVGAAYLVGAGTLVEESTTALASAGRAALGTPGVVAVSVAAALATASAINSTLFATAQLVDDVAEHGQLPRWLDERHREVPRRSVLLLGGLAAGLAVLGSLGTLVEAASLAFLFAFGSVNLLALVRTEGRARLLAAAGLLGTAVLFVAGTVRLVRHAPLALAGIGALAVVCVLGRRWLLRRVTTSDGARVEG